MKHATSLLRRLTIPLAYLALMIVFTWPLAAHWGDSLALARGSDVWPHIWNFAWVRTALLDLHRSPYFTTSIFYPTGVPLAYHALNVFTATVSLPLQLVFGLVPAFNALMIGNLVAGAGAAYWLARGLGLARGPAWLVGGLFACSPPVGAAFAQGQAELVSVFWLPLYCGLLLRGAGLRALELPAQGRGYLVGAGVAGVGSLLAIPYWTVSLGLFTAVYALLELVWASRWDGRRALARVSGRLAVVGATAGVAVLPVLWLMGRGLVRAGADLGISGSGANDAVVASGSQDLLALFRPFPGGVDINQPHGANLGLGWTVLALAVLALALSRGPRRRSLWLWGGVALLAGGLALGPQLVLGGHLTGIPLPYAVLAGLPGAAAMRVPLRLDTLLALCMAVLAGQGAAALLPRLPGRAAWPLLAGAGLLAFAEFSGSPRVLIQPEAQPFFRDLAAHPSPCLGDVRAPLAACDAVLELPLDGWSAPGLFHQAISRHPMLGGYISRHYPYPFPGDAPGVRQLVAADPAGLGADIFTPTPGSTAQAALDYYGVRYVVVHDLPHYGPQAANLRAVLDRLLGPTGQTADGLTVYTVPRGAGDAPILYPGAGWDAYEQGSGTAWRWTDGNATLHLGIPRAAAGAYLLDLQVYALDHPRTLIAALDGHELGRYPVAPSPGSAVSLPLLLPAGDHGLTLVSVEPAVTPLGDARALSLGYHAVTLRRR